MGWTKRESVRNIVVLGDGEGQAQKVSGLLASITADPNPKFKNRNFELVQKNGESLVLAGSASLERQIGETDIGHFVKCQFKGWGNSPNGKFKDIEVLIFEGEPTAEMKAWPRWAECQPNGTKAATKQQTKDVPADVPSLDAPDFPDDPDDDLPF